MHIPQIEAVKPAFVTDYLDEDPIMIAYSEEDTQPLPTLPKRSEETWFCAAILLFCLSFCGVGIYDALTYPTVTIDILPIEKSVAITTTLAVPQRQLTPITLTKSLSTITTGKGHQDATRASGELTFYNGLLTSQTVAAGTLLTGSDGTQVITDQPALIPPAAPPIEGHVTVSAHAVQAGSYGNVPALTINTACCLTAVLVKNLGPFYGGRDARDFQAVSQGDIEQLTRQLKQVLSQHMETTFPLHPGEELFLTNCAFKITPDHQPGEEATTVTVTVTHTCHGTAYDKQVLQAQATDALGGQEALSLGAHYLLVGTVQTSVLSVSPFRARCFGVWRYHLTPPFLDALKSEIAGTTPREATTILLHTGVIERVDITQKTSLPEDPDYLHFQVLISL